ncbi:hypothetical protein ACFV1N_47925 [Streptosporangium canum]|uniref:hypothetical protein n=1 Tax=Streptosporangium canum TaxID=324952 RepID=UPI0036D0DF58
MKNSTASLVDFNFAAKLSGAIVSGVIAVTAVIGGHAATTAAGTTWDSASTVAAGTTWDSASTVAAGTTWDVAGTDGTTWDTASTDGTTWDTADGTTWDTPKL